ncbi:legumain-like [Acanthaster planci]|uniref:legumain n=1 Tax=Acanthaster planci TaxID=133434 RepID=A0A8B7YXD5_ACAPL|nr:legumain-like [Acanthaster planci]
MRNIQVLLLVLAVSVCYSAAAPSARDDKSVHWALLVAGSSGWGNYRHQADVCHAYQVLHNHGIPDENIVVMMYDDIARNENNPHKGVIINRPKGPNVYTGVPKDYTGEQVTPKNFLAILQGEKAAMQGIGSGKVIASGPNDNVFVFFSDHGATDLIAFPSSTLSEKELQGALEKMAAAKKFKKLVFYLEACESGSMFDSYKIDNIYTTTASSPDESSYACYFDQDLETYLGDVYSVKWMENSDKADFSIETLLQQFKIVKTETNTSHVHKYGDMSFDKDHLGEYQGKGPKIELDKSAKLTPVPLDAVPSPEVPMAILHRRLMAARDPRKRSEILKEITTLGQSQQAMVSVLQATVKTVLNDNGDRFDQVMTRHGVQVTNWDCYKTAVDHFSEKCFPFKKHDYALSLMYILANLCEEQVPTQLITTALDMQCK